VTNKPRPKRYRERQGAAGRRDRFGHKRWRNRSGDLITTAAIAATVATAGRRSSTGCPALCRGHLEIEQALAAIAQGNVPRRAQQPFGPAEIKTNPRPPSTGDCALSPGIADRKAIGVAA
jgi:hypothetical protein